jgi:uridine kinase
MEQIIAKINELLKSKSQVVISIDGCAASGKTTLAEKLSKLYSSDIIHMDHFFLPVELRTKDRLNEPGGNIHYERFKEEVINNLGNIFSYNVYNCSKCSIDSKKTINNRKLIIVEGSYSLHPYFGKYYDLSIFLDIDKDEQIDRIRNRDGEKLLKMFIEKWIKYETNYHDYYNVKTTADIYVK